MFCENLSYLRKMNKLSQEELAERLDVSRQTLSKWETGESLPDIEKCQLLASIFDVSLDELVSYDSERSGLPIPPKGKHVFGIVTVGDKGQIVIPAKARKIFQIESGDHLSVWGMKARGLRLSKKKNFLPWRSFFRKSYKDS